jgi:hypothetical protein
LRLDRLELAPVRAVHDVPPARAQSLADAVGGFEILGPPALDALGEQALRLLWI